MLAAVGTQYSFTKAELEALTAADIGFWLGGLAGLMKRQKGSV